MSTRISAVGPCLAIADVSVTSSQMEAVSTSLCWAEAVARTHTLDVGSRSFFEEMTAELARIEWNVTAAGDTDYHQSGSNVTPAHVVPDVLRASVDSTALEVVERLFDRIGGSPTAPALGSLLSPWWASQSSAGASRAFAVCPATVDASTDAVQSTIAFYEFSFTSSSWQSFFVTSIGAHADVKVRTAQLEISMSSWNEIAADILKRLGSAATSQVSTLIF